LAGIGFELKKLFKDKGILGNLKAYAYSTIVSVGPFILCTIMIILIQILLSYFKISDLEREIFLATIVYTFVFSQIVTSGFSMIITRFLSDKLYNKEFEDIMPSFYGIISICIVIGAIPAIIFYKRSPIDFNTKMLSYILYMQLIIIWIQSVYLSALKDYIKIVKAFLAGIMVTLVTSFLLIKFSNLVIRVALLISMNLGISIILTALMIYLQSFFTEDSKKYFMFLKYFDRYPSLFFVNLFYVLGLYIHNFVFWGSNLRRIIAHTYIYAPIYDVPTFYAYLSIIPSMVIFVVFIETAFYEKYRDYYSEVTNGGNYNEIDSARKDMINVLKTEMSNMIQLQLFFTIIIFVLGNILLTRIGVIQLSIEIFNILLLGAYLNIMMFITILIQLYFEYRKGALITASVFLISNFLFSIISIQLGENSFGLGLFFAALVSLLIGLKILVDFLNKINYHTFCSQPVFYKERRGIFTIITEKLYNE